jgi:hypothetical protein
MCAYKKIFLFFGKEMENCVLKAAGRRKWRKKIKWSLIL